MKIQTILVPIDFSDGSRVAIEHAVGFARRFDAAVHVAHIFDVPMLHADTMVHVGGSPPMTLVDHMRNDLTRMLDEFIDAIDVRGVVLSRSLEMGPPTDTILGLTADYDLVVMGTHGRTGFKRLVLGSVAEEVVRTARCPVLVVHGKGEKKAEH